MKIISSFVVGLPKFGVTLEGDHMCNTELQHQGKWYGGAEQEFTLPEWKEGDEFTLSIPSGTLKGVVTVVQAYGPEESAEAVAIASVFGGPQPAAEGVRVYLDGEWDGKEGGMTSGRFAFGRFNLIESQETRVVESSLLPAGKKVSYGGYQWAKNARHFLGLSDKEASKLVEEIADREARNAAGLVNLDNRVFIAQAPPENLNPVLTELELESA